MGKFLLLGSFAVNGNKKAPTAYSSAQELNLHALNLHLEKLILIIELERDCEGPALSGAREQKISFIMKTCPY